MGTWQSAQSRIKKKKKIKLAIAVLVIILATLIFGNSVKFLTGLLKPLDASLLKRSIMWDGGSNLYLAVKSGENISLLILNPTEKKVMVLDIPPETEINVPGGFGSWPVRSIFGLGEKKSQGATLLKNSLSDFYGLPVSGYLETQLSPLEAVKVLKNNPLPSLTGRSQQRSDLTIFELLRLYLCLGAVRSDKITELDLLALEVLDPFNLADGTKVYRANSRLDTFIQENLSEPKIKSEQLSVAVLNGTNHSGLAQRASRMISNLGGNVIITDNTSLIPNSFVTGQGSFTKNKLTEIFSSKYAKINTQPASRAQVVVYLGEDFKP